MKDAEEQIRKTQDHLDAELEALLECVDELKEVLNGAKEQVDQHRAEREAAIKERWTYQKKLSALERLNRDYDALAAENNKLRSDRDKIREALRRIQASTRALITEYRP